MTKQEEAILHMIYDKVKFPSETSKIIIGELNSVTYLVVDGENILYDNESLLDDYTYNNSILAFTDQNRFYILDKETGKIILIHSFFTVIMVNLLGDKVIIIGDIEYISSFGHSNKQKQCFIYDDTNQKILFNDKARVIKNTETGTFTMQTMKGETYILENNGKFYKKLSEDEHETQSKT